MPINLDSRMARKWNSLVIFLALLSVVLGLAPAENAKSPAKILVGPNILVSRDGDIPHVELMIAANPRNPKNFLGGAITFASRDGGAACKAYASMDGGNTWWGSVFPEQVRFGGGDGPRRDRDQCLQHAPHERRNAFRPLCRLPLSSREGQAQYFQHVLVRHVPGRRRHLLVPRKDRRPNPSGPGEILKAEERREFHFQRLSDVRDRRVFRTHEGSDLLSVDG